jgi:hypothetical protein
MTSTGLPSAKPGQRSFEAYEKAAATRQAPSHSEMSLTLLPVLATQAHGILYDCVARAAFNYRIALRFCIESRAYTMKKYRLVSPDTICIHNRSVTRFMSSTVDFIH